jgi:hypothetical protein
MDVHSSLIRGVRVSHLPGIALKAIHTRPFGKINLSLSPGVQKGEGELLRTERMTAGSDSTE